MRSCNSCFARWSVWRREALSPLPARLMKYVSIRMPDAGPLGETFFEASDRAITGALLVNRSFGGWVESDVTVRTHRFFGAVFLFAADFFFVVGVATRNPR